MKKARLFNDGPGLQTASVFKINHRLLKKARLLNGPRLQAASHAVNVCKINHRLLKKARLLNGPGLQAASHAVNVFKINHRLMKKARLFNIPGLQAASKTKARLFNDGPRLLATSC